MAKKRAIIKTAFDKLYADLGGDLSPFLKGLVRTNPWIESDSGTSVGHKWSPTNKGTLLLEVTPADLAFVKSTKKLLGRFFTKDKTNEPIEYISSAHAGVSFLLCNQWGDDYNSNKAACDSLNTIAASLGKDPYISPADEKTMMESSRGSSLKASTLPAEVVPNPIAEDDYSLPLNLILYGPPGTGKTYNSIFKTLDILEEPIVYTPGATGTNRFWFNNEEADRNKALVKFSDLKKAGRIVFTTFHQSMSYEDFIEGIKPTLDTTPVGYTLKPGGLFKQISDKASADSANKYVLIIDEINRGNVANIFGELITLIEDDKRTTKYNTKTKKYDEENLEGITVKLPYSKEEFGVPGNLYIIGTMNTADRSVEALDSALRRRFSFVEMMPKPELLKNTQIEGIGKSLQDLLTTINERIEILKDREHRIGHSYFMMFKDREEVGPDELKSVFTDKIIPLLQEYFYGDYEKIQLVVGKGFVIDENNKPHFSVENIEVDIPEKRFSIIDPDMKDALEKLFNSKDAAE